MQLSIIIPMYNHEEYVEECIVSILEKLHANIEVIVVDDCSTDNSLRVVENMQKKYDSLKILKNEKNMGCAESINKGIQEAKGKYIGINNSDDYVDKDYYNKMLELAIKEDADVVCASIASFNQYTKEIVYNNILVGNITTLDPEVEKVMGEVPFQIEPDILLGHWTASSSSTKIIKKEFYLNFPFNGKNANDIPAIYPIMATAKKVFFYPNLYLYYRNTEGSLSRTSNIDSVKSVIDSMAFTLELLSSDEIDEKYKQILFANNCISYFYNVVCNKSDDEKLESIEYFYKKIIVSNKNIIDGAKKHKYLNNFFKVHNLVGNSNKIEILELLEKGEFYKIILLLYKEKNNKMQEKYNIHINVLQDENKKLEDENKKLEDQNKKLEDENKKLERVINEYNNSRSWRITKPLRETSILIQNCKTATLKASKKKEK